MSKKDAAALAGWAQNPRVPVAERLAAAKQALNTYVDQQDELRELLSYYRTRAEDDIIVRNAATRAVYADVADKLAAILDGE